MPLVLSRDEGNRIVRIEDQQLIASATDLTTFMGCRHATVLDKRVTLGSLEKPYWDDRVLPVLWSHVRVHRLGNS